MGINPIWGALRAHIESAKWGAYVILTFLISHPQKASAMRGVIRIDELFWVGPQPTETEIRDMYQHDGLESLVNLNPEQIDEVRAPHWLPVEDERRIAQSTSLLYVHFPISTLGMSVERAHELLECVDRLPLPVYFHATNRKLAGAVALIPAARRAGWDLRQAMIRSAQLDLGADAPGFQEILAEFIPSAHPARR